MPRPTGPLLVLCLLLMVWEPLRLAWSFAPDLAALTSGLSGTWSEALFVTAQVIVAAANLTAGLSLWQGQWHAVAFARIAVAGAAGLAAVRFAWFPGNVPPGLRVLAGSGLVGYYGLWLLYLLASPRARGFGQSHETPSLTGSGPRR